MGPLIPLSARVELDRSVGKAKAEYVDACNHLDVLSIGPQLEDVLLQAAHQTFTSIIDEGPDPATTTSDVRVRIRLLEPSLKMKSLPVYDRVPAELTLDALVEFRDKSGKLLAEQPLQAVRQERLVVIPNQKRCEYSTIDGLAHDAAVALSIEFMREARALLQPNSPLAGNQTPSIPSKTTGLAQPVLTFKATILDENGNLAFEDGERMKVRVEVVNTGASQTGGVSVVASGPPELIAQLQSTSLVIGALQPGESRAVEFTGTVPRVVQAHHAELVITVTEGSGTSVPPAQTLGATLQPKPGAGFAGPLESAFDSIDRIPAAVSAGRPHMYLLSIGISHHRDPQISMRKYAASDAELVAAYFRSLGGVPPSQIRLLQDSQALRSDIEEAVLDWLPAHVSSDSIVIVYFSGHAKVSSEGETFLVPYEGNRAVSRLLPLKNLQAGLERLKTERIVFIFDGSVSRLAGNASKKGKEPQWDLGGNIIRLIGTTGIHEGLEPDKLHHGLFTYYFLRGLRGEADGNLDGEVSLGELVAYLTRTVPAGAKNAFQREQRPFIVPPSNAGLLTATVLTKAPVDPAPR
jgi:hypothetical protein